MKIVIDIPKEQYENLAKIANAGKEPLGYWERVVMRGTPLPKGHGRLIDADALDTSILQTGFAYAITRRKLRYTGGDVRGMIANADTIIPPDKETESE